MEKFIINYTIFGFDRIEITDTKIMSKNNIEVIIVLDQKYDEQLSNYYNFVKQMLKNRNKVIIINANEKSELFKALAILMISNDCYDIYDIISKEAITGEYIENVESRNPGFDEVQTFIDGDVLAYSEIVNIAYGVESLVNQGDIDGLKTFIEGHMNSIEKMSSAINYMKKMADLTHSRELVSTIEGLKETASRYKDELKAKESKIEGLVATKDDIEEKSKEMVKQITKLKESNKELNDKMDSGATNVIKAYTECKTSIIQCKTNAILYVKEVSYVKYTNSLITVIMQWLKAKKLKAKLIIYDSNTELYDVYKALNNKDRVDNGPSIPVVTGKDYIENSSRYIGLDTPAFVITEPLPAVIKDVLESSNDYDVVIVYDKMKCRTDIVSGNFVTKMFVINSKSEYTKVKSALNISDTSIILTNDNCKIDGKSLDIPYIADYQNLTLSAKTTKYMKLQTRQNNLPLVKSILERSRINTL